MSLPPWAASTRGPARRSSAVGGGTLSRDSQREQRPVGRVLVEQVGRGTSCRPGTCRSRRSAPRSRSSATSGCWLAQSTTLSRLASAATMRRRQRDVAELVQLRLVVEARRSSARAPRGSSGRRSRRARSARSACGQRARRTFMRWLRSTGRRRCGPSCGGLVVLERGGDLVEADPPADRPAGSCPPPPGRAAPRARAARSRAGTG